MCTTFFAQTEESFTRINDELRKIKETFKTKSHKIGMLDAALRVNNENLTAVPNRIKTFKKEWNILCSRIEKVQGSDGKRV